MRRTVIITGIMILILCLTACRKQGSRDLFKEKPDNPKMVEAVSPQPSACKSMATSNTDEEGSDESLNSINESVEHSNCSGKTGDGGDAMEVNGRNISEEFYYEELPDEVIKRITGKSYGSKCDVPYEDLRYVRVLYWGFDQETHKGEMIVNKLIAKDTVEIFNELYNVKYPIERMVLVDEYDADDNASMTADNTSSFNYRNIDGTDTISLHSYGLAIDINPLYNPYVRTISNKNVVLPKSGTEYADRSLDCSYYINKEDACYKAFIKHGFTWGGVWKHSKDYQHFEKRIQ